MKIDKITLKRLQLLYPVFGDLVYSFILQFYSEHEIKICISQTLRTFKDQENLYAQGRTQGGRVVTNAMPGDSFHNYGLAADIAFVGIDPYLEKKSKSEQDFYWMEVGRIAKINGLEWGGDFKSFKDRPHMQMSFGLTIAQIKADFNKGGLFSLWERLDKINNRPYGKGYIGDYVFYRPTCPKNGERLN